jgi:hypothetical protein
MQHIFLKLHDIEDSEMKDFILETLRREFRDVAIEAMIRINVIRRGFAQSFTAIKIEGR